MSAHPKITIWLWPTGLFPRRIIYYFVGKGLTTSTLEKHNISLIPVTLQADPPGLHSLSGYEERPMDTSLPIMRVQPDDGDEFWVYETQGIFSYFEEMFSVDKGYVDLTGANMRQRARTRDLLSCLSDATASSFVQTIHGDRRSTSWSGLSESEMSSSAAKHAEKRFHMLLGRLERWIESDVVGKATMSLAGDGASVTLADLSLMAQVEYAMEVYGADWVTEHGVLRTWCERIKGAKWVVGREKLLQAERAGKWEEALGV